MVGGRLIQYLTFFNFDFETVFFDLKTARRGLVTGARIELASLHDTGIAAEDVTQQQRRGKCTNSRA